MQLRLQPMTDAPRDRTPVLLKMKAAEALPERAHDLAGIVFVGRHAGCFTGWSFAAPVGYGGIPDTWLEGWAPIPDMQA